MCRDTRFLVLLFVFCLIIMPIYAEQVILKNGEMMTGKAVKQNDKSVFLDVGFTSIEIPVEAIEKVEKDLSKKENLDV